MLSTSLFNQNGTRYNQKAVFGSTFTLNQTALEEVGLPALTGVLLRRTHIATDLLIFWRDKARMLGVT